MPLPDQEATHPLDLRQLLRRRQTAVQNEVGQVAQQRVYLGRTDDQDNVWVPFGNRHVAWIGPTGQAKTSHFILAISQLINWQVALVAFDPHLQLGGFEQRYTERIKGFRHFPAFLDKVQLLLEAREKQLDSASRVLPSVTSWDPSKRGPITVILFEEFERCISTIKNDPDKLKQLSDIMGTARKCGVLIWATFLRGGKDQLGDASILMHFGTVIVPPQRDPQSARLAFGSSEGDGTDPLTDPNTWKGVGSAKADGVVRGDGSSFLEPPLFRFSWPPDDEEQKSLAAKAVDSGVRPFEWVDLWGSEAQRVYDQMSRGVQAKSEWR